MTASTIPEHALECDRATHDLIRAIVHRLRDEHPEMLYDGISLSMDLTLCHNLKHVNLQTLHDARPFDFVHDISGIMRNLDRETGKLFNCFLPRCSPKSDGD